MGKQWLSRRAAQLPAVLHDAALRTLTIDYTSHRATFGLDLCVGDPRANTDAEREAYRPVTLTISGLLWCVIECPESGANMGEGLWIDAGPLTASSKGQTCPAWRTGPSRGGFSSTSGTGLSMWPDVLLRSDDRATGLGDSSPSENRIDDLRNS